MIFSRLVQLKKADLYIVSKPSGNVRLSIDTQSAKALAPTYSSPSGRTMYLRSRQPSNANELIFFVPLPKTGSVRLLQPENAYDPISRSYFISGKITVLSAVQSRNVSLPIVLSPLPKFTLSSFVQPLNVRRPSVSRLSGSVISFTETHPWNAPSS